MYPIWDNKAYPFLALLKNETSEPRRSIYIFKLQGRRCSVLGLAHPCCSCIPVRYKGFAGKNKCPWSLLPKLHQQCLSLLDMFVLLLVRWFLACAHFSFSWKKSRRRGCPTPSVFLRSHPTYRYSCMMLGSLSRVWLSLNTSCRFLSSLFSGLTHFDRVRGPTYVHAYAGRGN